MGLPAFSLLWTSRAATLLSRLLLVFSVAALVGCGTSQPEYDPTSNWNAERLFQDGKTEMNGANWRVAKERFLAVESRFPFGVYAQQSLVNLAYCYWKDKEPELALATLGRFQQQFPSSPLTDYALYLKGLINFTPPSAIHAHCVNPTPRLTSSSRSSQIAATHQMPASVWSGSSAPWQRTKLPSPASITNVMPTSPPSIAHKQSLRISRACPQQKPHCM